MIWLVLGGYCPGTHKIILVLLFPLTLATQGANIYSSLNLKDKKDFFEKLNFNLYFMLDSIFIMHIIAEFKGYMETGKS